MSSPNRTTTLEPAIDTQDLKYQVSKDHAPDKEGTWPMPIAKEGWVMAHDTLRLEIKQIRLALEAVSSRNKGSLEEGWIVEYLQTLWKMHESHIHDHHSNEDDILVPVLKERFIWPEKLEADHKQLEDIMQQLDTMFMRDLKQGGTLDMKLVAKWKQYQDHTLPHLKEEETTMLPLQRAYFEPKEIIPVTQKIVQMAPKSLLGACIHCVGGKEPWQEFMKQEKIPGFVWYLEFNGAYKNYLKVFVARVDALKEGTPIVEEPKSLLQTIFCCF